MLKRALNLTAWYMWGKYINNLLYFYTLEGFEKNPLN